ncbi:MAG: hypothetical protein E4H20_05640 [Spirochaetales bacterium]|nr:MAG: hypothetical protein E4H20_05640 [Spirochaetales bacterium]
MKVIELVNLKRKETHLYYRKEFKADAVLQFMEQTSSTPVEFTLEHQPLGGVDVRIVMVDDLDYPLMPIVAELKRFILDLHGRGSLP